MITIGSILGWFITRRAMSGVVRVTKAAVTIGQGNFSFRVPLGNEGKEIQNMVMALYDMVVIIELLMKELKDEDTIAVLKTEAKKRKESIEAYEAAERDDLVEVEKKELEIIETYLPEQMSEEEVEAKVKQIIDKIPEEERDFGKVMGMVMKELKGQADGQVVNQAVKNAKLVSL